MSATPKQAYSSRKYSRLVEWIAFNDNPGDDEPLAAVADYLTVVMVAHCYDLQPIRVAADVLNARKAGTK